MSPKAAEAQNVIKANAADRIIFFITRLLLLIHKIQEWSPISAISIPGKIDFE